MEEMAFPQDTESTAQLFNKMKKWSSVQAIAAELLWPHVAKLLRSNAPRVSLCSAVQSFAASLRGQRKMREGF